jgi:hypothetical protein
MSKKTGNRKRTTDGNHLSHDSEDSSTNEFADEVVDSPLNKSSAVGRRGPRMLRYSQQNKKYPHAFTITPRDNEFSNKAQIESSDISDDDANLRNNSGVYYQNELLSNTKQQVVRNDRSLASYHIRESNNNEAMTDDAQHGKKYTKQLMTSANATTYHENRHKFFSQGKRTEDASTEHSDSDDGSMDDENQQAAHYQTTGTTCFSDHHRRSFLLQKISYARIRIV